LKKYELDNLNEKEVMELIKYEKNPENLMEYQDIYNQIVSTLVYETGSYYCKIRDRDNNITYSLGIHTTPINSRFSVGLRFTEVNKQLLRLDFGDTLRHTNNQGKVNEYIVHGSHAHFNSPNDKYSKKNVIPIADLPEFKNLKLIHDVFIEYIRYTNIKEGTDINGTG